jgi:tyrosine aminotransferase
MNHHGLTRIFSRCTGTLQARTAIAQAHTESSAPLTANDIILANGCSGALEMCVNVLCNEGQNILLPRPGFSLYGSLAATRFVETRYYNLLVSVYTFAGAGCLKNWC